MKRILIGYSCIFLAAMLTLGCAAVIDSGTDSDETQIVSVEYKVTGNPKATVMIPDNDNEDTFYFIDSSLPFSYESDEEEFNHVFIRVIYNETAPAATITATIYRNGEVFLTNSWGPLTDINDIIEGYLDR